MCPCQTAMVIWIATQLCVERLPRGVLPARCGVRGVADSVQALQGDRVVVTVPVGHLGPGVHMVAGQVDAPPWLTVIGLDPAEFQVVVGHVEPIKGDSLRTDPADPRE